MSKSQETILIYTTFPSQSSADEVAQSLIEQKLAACIHIHNAGSSYYEWQGQTCQDKEHMMVIKTLNHLQEAVFKAVRSLHPYTCPALIAWSASSVDPDYHNWLCDSVISAP